MDVQLRELECKVRNLVLDARALCRAVESDLFHQAWMLATEEQKRQMLALVSGVDKRGVEKLVRSILSASSLEGKSIKELKPLAIAAGVQYVNHKTKEELIEEIRKDADARKTG